MNVIAVAIGGAMGSVARYWLSTSIQQTRLGSEIPWGTMAVNVSGSLLIGLLFTVLQSRSGSNELARLLFAVGFLGGFTTFSTFSIETLQLMQSGFWIKAMFNIFTSVTGCILAAYAGMLLGRNFIS